MELTEQDALNLITTQRLVNENFQLRDVVQQLQAQFAKQAKIITALEKDIEDEA